MDELIIEMEVEKFLEKKRLPMPEFKEDWRVPKSIKAGKSTINSCKAYKIYVERCQGEIKVSIFILKNLNETLLKRIHITHNEIN